MGPKPLPVPATATDNPSDDEETLVHEVYEAIAPHFARTRFKVSHALRGMVEIAGASKMSRQTEPVVSPLVPI